jgi:predicted dehydrogenase
MAKPIRIGFIGLSSNNKPQYAGAWGQNAHLPYLRNTDDFVITALCNSSVESAKKAIQVHGLDASKVRAYGDPTSLASDPEVDLVVCSVNVMEHYSLMKPAVLAGKMAFCEWPLASNLTQMKDLVDLAEKNKSKTMVGLQGRNGAYNMAIRSFIGEKQGQLGQLLSTSMIVYGSLQGMANPRDIAYLMNIETGGNLFTISAIHSWFASDQVTRGV